MKTSKAFAETHCGVICHNLGMKEGNIIFNDTLNTFYLRLYGIRHMVKDHSRLQERKPAAGTTWTSLSDRNKGSFICTFPETG